jgi:uncharacterized protein with FMN-binding domain
MLSHGKKRQSLVGKLLLSTALVVISLAYGWWQRHTARPDMATAPMPGAPNSPATPNQIASARRGPAVTPPATKAAPDASATPGAAAAAPQTKAPAAAKIAPAETGQDAGSPASTPPLTALAELRMYQPPPPQLPLPLITGTPAPGAAPPIPPGAHLEDGDYLSDMQQFEWGDLQVKILVHGGQITGAQLVQYPDHRAESLQISQMASPLLNSEVIQSQHSKVDIVSSATDTSYVYRDAVASAIMKATRH